MKHQSALLTKVRLIGAFFAACLLVGAAIPASGQAVESSIRKFTTPTGVEYGVWGNAKLKHAPILFVLAGTIESTLDSQYFRQCGNQLAEHGFLLVSLDIPCHGKQSAEKICSGLGGWAVRAKSKHDFVAENNKHLSDILDHLIETKLADPDRIAICGTSRGGFLALHFLASDDRVRCAAAFAPVTNLAALTEFQKIAADPYVQKLSLAAQAEKLAGRPAWIVIGDRDERVGTDQAIECVEQITAAAKQKRVENAAELLVVPEPRGHTTPKGSAEKAAKWILAQMPKPAK